jgi:hypothetical protein
MPAHKAARKPQATPSVKNMRAKMIGPR